MKRVIVIALLCAFALSAAAQEENKVVTRHGTVRVDTKEKEKKVRTGDWYNLIGVNFAYRDKSEHDIYGSHYEEATVLSINYIRLRQLGIFYFGPGLHGKYNFYWRDPGFDLFLHGRIEAPQEMLGFNKVHPYLGLSGGIQYSAKFTPYFDYSLGLSIDCGTHSAICISYYATLVNCRYEYWYIYSGGSGTETVLCHGAELSFRF